MTAFSATGAEYRGDQTRSPLMRFLHNLFMGESGTPSKFSGQPSGQTYQFTSLYLGSSKVGATLNNSSSQQDIWAGYGAQTSSSVSTGTQTPSSKSGIRLRSSGTSVGINSAADGYVSPLSTASAASSVTGSGSGSGSASYAGASSAEMTSFMTIQTMQSPMTATTTMAETTTSQTSGDGFSGDPYEPLPVGDGTCVLLFLAFAYLFFQRKRFKELLKV